MRRTKRTSRDRPSTRAIESMNAVNDEIAAIIQSTWGRNGKKA